MTGSVLRYRLKQSPDAFIVYERLDWQCVDALGTGASSPHRLLLIEKQGLNTLDVVDALAQQLAVPAIEVGYAGRKDRHALTRQWLSIPSVAKDWREVAAQAFAPMGGQVRWLTSIPVRRKLRVGQLLGNWFRLRILLEEPLPPEVLRQALGRLREGGFPNRFGEQRLNDAALADARRVLARRTRRQKCRDGAQQRRERGWALSVLRAALFNAVVDARLACDEPTQRLRPADDRNGPLWGRGRSPATAEEAAFEARILASYQSDLELLEFGGVQQARRLLVAPVSALSGWHDGDELHLDFALPAGSYATELVAHLVHRLLPTLSCAGSSPMSVGLLLRGMAMGIAEVVPGVSGGTIAFVTGIYDELIRTLAGLDLRALRILVKRGPVVAWRELNLTFLMILGIGMVLAVGIFARLIEAALESAAPLVWAFFFGLILYSVFAIGRTLPRQRLLLLLPIGVLLGYALSQLTPTGASLPDYWFLLGGALAISAWLLPAVSGSFLLLVLGLYEPMVTAVNSFALDRLALFCAGCVLGLLLFSKLLHWLMTRFRETLLALLTGFMLGALPKLWPWQLGGVAASPADYATVSGEPSFVLAVVPVACLGALLLWLLGKLAP